MASSYCLPTEAYAGLSFVRYNIEDITCTVNTLLPLTYQSSFSSLPVIAAFDLCNNYPLCLISEHRRYFCCACSLYMPPALHLEDDQEH